MRKRRKPVTAIIILLYIAAAAVLLLGVHPFVHALGKKSVTVEIGEEGDQVKGVLSKSGVLTISGSGKTRNYTEETPPFAEYADQISAVVIKEGVTSIGDYLLYNCGNLKGTLTLPQTVVWIGDGAFGGADYESAPKFTTVMSEFQSAEIGRRKPGAELPESETAPESTATPGNAGAGPGEPTKTEPESSSEAGPGMTEESTGAQQEEENRETENGPAESEEESGQGQPGADSDEGQKESGSDQGTTDGNSAGGSTAGESSPGGSAAVPNTPEEGTTGPNISGGSATDQNTSERSPEAEHSSENGPSAKNPTGSNLEGGSAASEPPSLVSGAGLNMKAMGSITSRQNLWFKLSTPSSAATGSNAAEEADDDDQDEEDETEEDYEEDGELTNDLYMDIVLISSLDEGSKSLYTTEIITTQIIGTDIFYSGQNGAYKCSETNFAFEEAAMQAGYRKADRFIEVDLEGSVVLLPVVDGVFYAPDYPEDEESREATEDGLFYDSFTGWIMERDLESMGDESPVYTPGSAVPIEEGTDQISLFGKWEKACTIIPEVSREKAEQFTTYTLIDGNTGSPVQETDGYLIHYQWQICRPQQGIGESVLELDDTSARPTAPELSDLPEAAEPSALPATNEPSDHPEAAEPSALPATNEPSDHPEAAEPSVLPATNEPSALPATAGPSVPAAATDTTELPPSTEPPVFADPSDESSWEDIEGADSAVYRREAQREDEASYFRVKISIEKQTYFRSAPEPIILLSEPASGLYTLKHITVTYAPGTGAGGTAPEPDVIEEGARFTPKANPFTRNTEDGLVFTGWSAAFNGASAKLPSGTALAEGGIINPNKAAVVLEAATGISSPSITLTAQWSSAKVIYVNSSTGNDSRDGLTEANAVKTLNQAYSLLPADGTAETNVIQLLADYSSDASLGNQSYKRNVTIRGKGKDITTLKCPVTVRMWGDLILQDISLSGDTDLYCNRNNLIADTTTLLKGASTYDASGGANYGVPAGTGKLHIYSLGTVASDAGPRGTNEDDPIIIKVLGEGSNFARLVGGGCVPSGLTTAENPAYVELTVSAGNIGIVCSGSVDGQKNGKSYIYTKITITGGSIYSVLGGQHANGYTGTSSTLYGGFQFYMYGGNVTTLYGGPLGRSKSYDNVAEIDTELNIFDGTISTLYGGGATGAFNGSIQINIHGGTIGTFYGGGYGKSPYVSDYRNDTAKVVGNIDTHISGGTINGDVYAGGGGAYTSGRTGSAKIEGDVSLEVSGGTIKGNVFGGGAGLSEDGTAAKITGNVALTISGGTIEKNVYGGGNLGTIEGNTTLTVTGSPSIGGVIYGGGNNSGTINGTEVIINTSLGTESSPKTVFGAGNGSGTQVQTSKVTVGSLADFYGTVYGGGEQGGTGQATVELTGGRVHGDVYGGGNAASVGGTVTVKSHTGSTVTGNIYGGSNSNGSVSGLIGLEIAGAAKNVFGAGNGSSTSAAAGTSVTVSNGAAIGENVYGGGAEGASTSTEVIVNGGTVGKHVFGGGNLVGTGTAVVRVADGADVKGSIYGGSNSGGEVTESRVSITGAHSGSFFGGGFGSGTSVKTSSVSAENLAVLTGSLYGGGEQGAVEQSGVTLKAGSSAANLFGGGSQANVTGSAKILVESGAKAGNVYGGSNNSGIVKSPAITIQGKAENVYGAGKGSPTITTAPAVTAENGAVITSIYGGGDAGQTQSGTTVTLKSGSTGTNVFGGGNAAGITGSVIVLSETGSKAQYLYGGSNSSGTVTQTTVTVNGTIGGTGQSGTPEGPGAVYGGGLGPLTQTQTPIVVISSAATVNGEVFGGGAQGPVTGNTNVTLDSSSHVNGNVYAGGDAAVVQGSTLLTAQEDSVIAGSLFGGGKGSTAEIQTDTRVIVFAHVTGGNVFGGGAEGAVRGSTHVDIAKGLIDGDGTSTGNVFGGSDKAKVHRDTLVHIGKEAADGTSTSVAGVSLVIKGTVFGGGNTTDNGSTFDASDPFVLGDSLVSVAATGYDIDNFNIYKSIFGDGNMCTVKGSRTVRLKDYQALGDQANTSIQRADSLTLENCSMELLGAVDSANLVPTVAYSLNRINDLVLKDGSTLKIQAPVNLVKNLRSQDDLGNPVTTNATDSAGEEPATKNIIDIQQGVQMELRTSEDVTTVGYGEVSGYFLLDVYDRENKKIESGIYVLGGYTADESLGGFLYGSGDHAWQKVVPSTDGSTWRNWAIGTDMVLTKIMAMSDKPAGEKILQLDSPWPADGTIYQLVEDSVEISTDLMDGSEFRLKDPDDIAAPDDADTTLGITVGAGSQGWVNPVTLGYIKGSSQSGALGNGFGGVSAEPLQTINNRSLKPTIQIELTNRIGIQNGDPSGEYPLTVQFQMENVKKLSDGSLSRQGTLTVILQIRREATSTYDDILLAVGKEYVRGTQTYTFDTAGGSAGMTISKKSSVTLQYARKTDSETEGARDHKLTFTTGEAPGVTGSSLNIPEGVTILAVDRTADYPVYAHYTVPAGGVTEVLLSQFIKNGTSDHYNRTSGINDKENYLFVFDFAGAPNWSQDGICAAFEPVYASAPSRKAKIVFSVASDPREYRMASPDATGETAEGKPYDREAVIPLTLTTWAGSTLGVDTTGNGVEMGARLRLKNREAGVYVPVPTDWLIKSEGTPYASAGSNITVPLGSSMMETTVSLTIEMKENSLPAGKYQWEIHLVSSPLAEYPGELTDTPLYLNFNLTDKQYSIKADWKDSSASRLYPSVSGTPRLPLEWKARLQADNGAETDHVSLKIVLQKKDHTAGSYEDIDFNTLFTNVSGVSQYEAWNSDVSASYQLKDTLPEGTYRLRFELVETSGGSDRTLTSDTENFIVTP